MGADEREELKERAPEPRGRPEPGSGPFAFLGRRRFLKYGLIGGGLVLGGVSGGLLALRGSAPSVAGLAVLSAHQHRTLRLLTEATFSGGPYPMDLEAWDLARAFDGFLVDEPAQNIDDLSMALTLIEFGPLLYDGRATVFWRLSAEERLSHWRSWAVSDDLLQRQVSRAFQKFLNLMVYDRPEVWPYLGYDGTLQLPVEPDR